MNATTTLTAEITTAYQQISTMPEDYVRLAKLLPLIDAPAGQVTETLIQMTRTGLVHLSPSSNRKALTAEDHAAAIRFGGEDKHLLVIEADYQA